MDCDPLPKSKMPSVCDEPIFHIAIGKIQPMKLWYVICKTHPDFKEVKM